MLSLPTAGCSVRDRRRWCRTAGRRRGRGGAGGREPARRSVGEGDVGQAQGMVEGWQGGDDDTGVFRIDLVDGEAVGRGGGDQKEVRDLAAGDERGLAGEGPAVGRRRG